MEKTSGMILFSGGQVLPNIASLLYHRPKLALVLHTSGDTWIESAKRLSDFTQQTLRIASSPHEIGRTPSDVSQKISQLIDQHKEIDTWTISAVTGARMMYLGALMAASKAKAKVLIREIDAGWFASLPENPLNPVKLDESLDIDKSLEDSLLMAGRPNKGFPTLTDCVNLQRWSPKNALLDPDDKPANLPGPLRILESFRDNKGNGSLVAQSLGLPDDRFGNAFELFVAAVVGAYGLPWEWGLKCKGEPGGEEQDVLTCSRQRFFILDCKQSEKEESVHLDQILKAKEQAVRWAGTDGRAVLIRPNMAFNNDLRSIAKRIGLILIERENMNSFVPLIEKTLFGDSLAARPPELDKVHELLSAGALDFFCMDVVKRRAKEKGIWTFGPEAEQGPGPWMHVLFDGMNIFKIFSDSLTESSRKGVMSLPGKKHESKSGNIKIWTHSTEDAKKIREGLQKDLGNPKNPA